MVPMNLPIGSLNFTQTESLSSCLHSFAADSLAILLKAGAWISEPALSVWHNWSSKSFEWLSRPDVLVTSTAWLVTFAVVTYLISACFSPLGVVGGSLAAAFQSYMYGAVTPAAGVFATLTSLGMMGALAVPVAIFAAILATFVAVLVWKMQH